MNDKIFTPIEPELQFTRCPNCAAVYRVNPEKLQLKKGEVRCGECREVFNAINHFVIQDADGKFLSHPQNIEQGPPELHHNIAETKVYNEVPSAQVETNETSANDIDTNEDSVDNNMHSISEVDTTDQQTSTDSQTPATNATENTGGLKNLILNNLKNTDLEVELNREDQTRTKNTELVVDPKNRLEVATVNSNDFNQPREEVERIAPRLNVISSEVDKTTIGDSTSNRISGLDIDNLSSDTELEKEIDTAEEGLVSSKLFAESAFTENSELKTDEKNTKPFEKGVFANNNAINMQNVDQFIEDRPNPLIGFFWFAICCGFIVLLGLQVKFFFVDAFAQDEKYRPALGVFCKVAKCELPPRKDSFRFVITNTRIDLHAQEPGALRVTAMLVNQASFDQPYPRIQITLTDRVGRVVGRRTYDPEFYLAKGQSNILKKGELGTLVFDLAHPHEKAVGFVVNVVTGSGAAI